MKAIAKVIDCEKDKAKVVSVRSSACSSCHNCELSGTCHAELVFGKQQQEVELTVKNSVGAKVGDTVELYSSSYKTLFVSLCVFVLPVFLSFAAYLLFDKISLNPYIPVVALLVSFVLTFFILVKIMNIYVKHSLKAYIVKIVEEGNSNIERE